MKRLLPLLLLTCGPQEPTNPMPDAVAECPKPPEPHSCIVTFAVEDLNQLFLYCESWKKGTYISPYDGIHYFWWCDKWVKTQ